MHFLEGVAFFADGDCEGVEPHGSAVVGGGHDAKQALVHFVEAEGVDFEEFEGGLGGGFGDGAVAFFLGVVADEIDEIVGDARGAAGAAGDLESAVGIEGNVEEFAGARYDFEEVFGTVVVESGLQGEATAKGGGEEAVSRGGADEGEAGDIEADGAGVWPLVDHDVDAVVLHGGVEVLFDGFGDAVDFVDEEDVAFFEIGEHASEVACLFHDGTGGDANVAPHFGSEDEGEGSLAEAGWTGEEDVIEGFAAFAGGARHYLEALDGFALADEFVEAWWAEKGLGLSVQWSGECAGEVVDSGVGGLGHIDLW